MRAFHIYRLTWIKFGTRDLNLMPLGIYNFVKTDAKN